MKYNADLNISQNKFILYLCMKEISLLLLFSFFFFYVVYLIKFSKIKRKIFTITKNKPLSWIHSSIIKYLNNNNSLILIFSLNYLYLMIMLSFGYNMHKYIEDKTKLNKYRMLSDGSLLLTFINETTITDINNIPINKNYHIISHQIYAFLSIIFGTIESKCYYSKEIIFFMLLYPSYIGIMFLYNLQKKPFKKKKDKYKILKYSMHLKFVQLYFISNLLISRYFHKQ